MFAYVRKKLIHHFKHQSSPLPSASPLSRVDFRIRRPEAAFSLAPSHRLRRCSRGRAFRTIIFLIFPGYALSISLICAICRTLHLYLFCSFSTCTCLTSPHRIRGAPRTSGGSFLPIESFVPSTFRQSASFVPCSGSAPRTREQVIFRLIRAFHIRLCKIPINNRRCISIDTFPHPAPRIPHPVIFPRLCTFPI